LSFQTLFFTDQPVCLPAFLFIGLELIQIFLYLIAQISGMYSDKKYTPFLENSRVFRRVKRNNRL